MEKDRERAQGRRPGDAQDTGQDRGHRPEGEKALLKSREAIREGLPIYQPLEEEWVFPPMVTRMIAVGEETGDIDGMLAKIAQFYESEVDAAVKALTSIIEPLMIVVVGAIVGGIIMIAMVSEQQTPGRVTVQRPAERRRARGALRAGCGRLEWPKTRRKEARRGPCLWRTEACAARYSECT
ncbi:MAG: type II secretion system F family protein [Actinobacteria bacterium]|nr:type II secretion system F family protein [Actinomycetota bacterium]